MESERGRENASRRVGRGKMKKLAWRRAAKRASVRVAELAHSGLEVVGHAGQGHYDL